LTPWIAKPVPFNIGQSAAGAGASAAFDDTGLRAYYKFSETSGDIIESSESDVALGSAADLQVTGATYDESSAPSSFSASMLFDGVNDTATAGTSLSQFNFLSTGNIESTICMWIRQVSSAPACEPGWFTTSGSSANTVGCDFFQQATMKLYFYISNGSTAHYALLDCGDDYIPDQTSWHFYVGTFDYSLGSNNQKMRRDDSNLKQATPVGSVGTGNARTPLKFMLNGRTSSNFINAYTCEASFWSKVMSTDDQTSLYNSGDGREIY